MAMLNNQRVLDSITLYDTQPTIVISYKAYIRIV